MELDNNSIVTQDHIDKAVKFDVHLGSSDTPLDAKKYLLAFIQKLLLQREKLDLQLLTDYLYSSVVTAWQTVLSTFENTNRKLLGVQSGSLIFTLFCPTISSAREVHDVSWIVALTQTMEQFMHKIGQYKIYEHSDDQKYILSQLVALVCSYVSCKMRV